MSFIIPRNVSQTSVGAELGLNSSAKTAGKTVTPVGSDASGQVNAEQGEHLAISDAMRVELRSLASAERNANDAIAMAQVADQALGKLGSVLAQMRDLVSGSTNAAASGHDAAKVEFSHLQAQVAGIREDAVYDGRPLLGEEAVEIGFDVIWDGGPSDRLALTLGGLDSLGLAASLPPGLASAAAAPSVVARIDDALSAIADKRARFTAALSRFAETTKAVQMARAGRSGGISPLENAASAEELANLAKAQILGAGHGSILGQANQLPAHAMSLLQD